MCTVYCVVSYRSLNCIVSGVHLLLIGSTLTVVLSEQAPWHYIVCSKCCITAVCNQWITITCVVS